MKAAVVQINSSDDKKRNIARACELVKEAIRQKARLIALPEVFNYRGKLDAISKFDEIAEKIPGESTISFCELASRAKVFILAGSIYESIGNSKKIYNTSILIGPSGKLLARYRKIHLFDAILGNKTVKESKFFKPGRQLVIGKVENFKAGLSICYDLRFPELYREYFKQGAGLLMVPSSFTKKTGAAHWEVLLRARAVENLCYVLAPNQIGFDGHGIESFGHSLIVNPWGEVLARASSDQEEVITADISMDVLSAKRKILPAIQPGVSF